MSGNDAPLPILDALKFFFYLPESWDSWNVLYIIVGIQLCLTIGAAFIFLYCCYHSGLSSPSSNTTTKQGDTKQSDFLRSTLAERTANLHEKLHTSPTTSIVGTVSSSSNAEDTSVVSRSTLRRPSPPPSPTTVAKKTIAHITKGCTSLDTHSLPPIPISARIVLPRTLHGLAYPHTPTHTRKRIYLAIVPTHSSSSSTFDPPLTEHALAQAVLVGRRLAAHRVDAVVTSPLTSAMHYAHVISLARIAAIQRWKNNSGKNVKGNMLFESDFPKYGENFSSRMFGDLYVDDDNVDVIIDEWEARSRQHELAMRLSTKELTSTSTSMGFSSTGIRCNAVTDVLTGAVGVCTVEHHDGTGIAGMGMGEQESYLNATPRERSRVGGKKSHEHHGGRGAEDDDASDGGYQDRGRGGTDGVSMSRGVSQQVYTLNDPKPAHTNATAAYPTHSHTSRGALSPRLIRRHAALTRVKQHTEVVAAGALSAVKTRLGQAPDWLDESEDEETSSLYSDGNSRHSSNSLYGSSLYSDGTSLYSDSNSLYSDGTSLYSDTISVHSDWESYATDEDATEGHVNAANRSLANSVGVSAGTGIGAAGGGAGVGASVEGDTTAAAIARANTLWNRNGGEAGGAIGDTTVHPTHAGSDRAMGTGSGTGVSTGGGGVGGMGVSRTVSRLGNRDAQHTYAPHSSGQPRRHSSNRRSGIRNSNISLPRPFFRAPRPSRLNTIISSYLSSLHRASLSPIIRYDTDAVQQLLAAVYSHCRRRGVDARAGVTPQDILGVSSGNGIDGEGQREKQRETSGENRSGGKSGMHARASTTTNPKHTQNSISSSLPASSSASIPILPCPLATERVCGPSTVGSATSAVRRVWWSVDMSVMHATLADNNADAQMHDQVYSHHTHTNNINATTSASSMVASTLTSSAVLLAGDRRKERWWWAPGDELNIDMQEMRVSVWMHWLQYLMGVRDHVYLQFHGDVKLLVQALWRKYGENCLYRGNPLYAGNSLYGDRSTMTPEREKASELDGEDNIDDDVITLEHAMLYLGNMSEESGKTLFPDFKLSDYYSEDEEDVEYWEEYEEDEDIEIEVDVDDEELEEEVEVGREGGVGGVASAGLGVWGAEGGCKEEVPLLQQPRTPQQHDHEQTHTRTTPLHMNDPPLGVVGAGAGAGSVGAVTVLLSRSSSDASSNADVNIDTNAPPHTSRTPYTASPSPYTATGSPYTAPLPPPPRPPSPCTPSSLASSPTSHATHPPACPATHPSTLLSPLHPRPVSSASSSSLPPSASPAAPCASPALLAPSPSLRALPPLSLPAPNAYTSALFPLAAHTTAPLPLSTRVALAKLPPLPLAPLPPAPNTQTFNAQTRNTQTPLLTSTSTSTPAPALRTPVSCAPQPHPSSSPLALFSPPLPSATTPPLRPSVLPHAPLPSSSPSTQASIPSSLLPRTTLSSSVSTAAHASPLLPPAAYAPRPPLPLAQAPLPSPVLPQAVLSSASVPLSRAAASPSSIPIASGLAPQSAGPARTALPLSTSTTTPAPNSNGNAAAAVTLPPSTPALPRATKAPSAPTMLVPPATAASSPSLHASTTMAAATVPATASAPLPTVAPASLSAATSAAVLAKHAQAHAQTQVKQRPVITITTTAATHTTNNATTNPTNTAPPHTHDPLSHSTHAHTNTNANTHTNTNAHLVAPTRPTPTHLHTRPRTPRSPNTPSRPRPRPSRPLLHSDNCAPGSPATLSTPGSRRRRQRKVFSWDVAPEGAWGPTEEASFGSPHGTRDMHGVKHGSRDSAHEQDTPDRHGTRHPHTLPHAHGHGRNSRRVARGDLLELEASEVHRREHEEEDVYAEDMAAPLVTVTLHLDDAVSTGLSDHHSNGSAVLIYGNGNTSSNVDGESKQLLSSHGRAHGRQTDVTSMSTAAASAGAAGGMTAVVDANDDEDEDFFHFYFHSGSVASCSVGSGSGGGGIYTHIIDPNTNTTGNGDSTPAFASVTPTLLSSVHTHTHAHPSASPQPSSTLPTRAPLALPPLPTLPLLSSLPGLQPKHTTHTHAQTPSLSLPASLLTPPTSISACSALTSSPSLRPPGSGSRPAPLLPTAASLTPSLRPSAPHTATHAVAHSTLSPSSASPVIVTATPAPIVTTTTVPSPAATPLSNTNTYSNVHASTIANQSPHAPYALAPSSKPLISTSIAPTAPSAAAACPSSLPSLLPISSTSPAFSVVGAQQQMLTAAAEAKAATDVETKTAMTTELNADVTGLTNTTFPPELAPEFASGIIPENDYIPEVVDLNPHMYKNPDALLRHALSDPISSLTYTLTPDDFARLSFDPAHHRQMYERYAREKADYARQMQLLHDYESKYGSLALTTAANATKTHTTTTSPVLSASSGPTNTPTAAVTAVATPLPTHPVPPPPPVPAFAPPPVPSEPLFSVIRRAEALLQTLAQCPYQDIVLVTHPTLAKVLLTRWSLQGKDVAHVSAGQVLCVELVC